MTKADERATDEVELLWHGAWAVEYVLQTFGHLLPTDRAEVLRELVPELHRIRKLRVERQDQRRRARVKARAARARGPGAGA